MQYQLFEDGHHFESLELISLMTLQVNKRYFENPKHKYTCGTFIIGNFPAPSIQLAGAFLDATRAIFEESISAINTIEIHRLDFEALTSNDELVTSIYKVVKYLAVKYPIKSITYTGSKDNNYYKLMREKLLNAMYLFFNVRINMYAQEYHDYNILDEESFNWKCYSQCRPIFMLRTIRIIYRNEDQFNHDSERFKFLIRESDLIEPFADLHEIIISFLLCMKRFNISRDVISLIVKIIVENFLTLERSYISGKSYRFLK